MYTLKYKNTYAPLIMQKTKLPTLQGQPLSLKNMLMKTIWPSYDLSFLPPCEPKVLFHVKGLNYVAKSRKTCLDRDFTLPNIQFMVL